MTQSSRSYAIDALRGLVMVLMALDHTRDFFTATGPNPTDLSQVSAALFLTRWVTHFCAPIFIFLTGVSAYLSFANGKSHQTLSVYLAKRGLWLIFLEITVMRLGWTFNANYFSTELQVLWAIGWSMLFLAGLLALRLSVRMVAAVGFLLVFCHNFFDSIHTSDWGNFAPLWTVLHEPGILFDYQGYQVNVFYPLVPWVGVIALGFAFGSVWIRFRQLRIKCCVGLGAGALALFCSLRVINVYGDPLPWAAQKSFLFTALSFVNVYKYPPSLDYLLLTLGVALCLLALFEWRPVSQIQVLKTFGRVPMFYYILHVYIIHALAVFAALVLFDGDLSTLDLMFHPPAGYGFSLTLVYVAWAIVLMILYPLCERYGKIKLASRHAVFSYI